MMRKLKWTIRSVTIYVRYDKNMIALQRLNGSGVERINHPRRSIKIQSKPSIRRMLLKFCESSGIIVCFRIDLG